MYIEELKDEEPDKQEGQQVCGGNFGEEGKIIVLDAKRALVGAGARALFYPTLLYNVVRNKIESEFHWWDRVDQFVLLGAVPFPTDVPRLKELGVCGVVTLNESYETLVPTSLYHEHDIDHLVIPTRDYLFAPTYGDICQAVDFIHGNTSRGNTTYVHCKAGRGRSTTIVLCYMVKHKDMTPEAAYEHVRSIRPRVLLASSQWQAVQNYYIHLKKTENDISKAERSPITTLGSPATLDPSDFDDGITTLGPPSDFDDGSVVLVTESDLDGYNESQESGVVGKNVMADSNLACRFQFVSLAAVARLSCLWVRSQAGEKVSKKLESTMTSSQLQRIGVDIRVY